MIARNPRHSAKKILLVDDQKDVRDTIALMLSVDNHVVTHAESGQAALKILQAGAEFDLMITDHRMAGMNGDELAQEVSALRPGLPIIMLTGFASSPAGPGNPVQQIVHKPVGLEELQKAVELAVRPS